MAADIVDRGIMLAGGGALVRGINDLLSDETGIFTHIAENPLLCVVNGCGEVLDDFKKLKRVVDTPRFYKELDEIKDMLDIRLISNSRWWHKKEKLDLFLEFLFFYFLLGFQKDLYIKIFII